MQPECQHEKKQQILFCIKYRSDEKRTTYISERNTVCCGLFNCQTSMKKPGVFTGYRAQKKPTVTAKVLLIFHK